jgi:hypothetical protein
MQLSRCNPPVRFIREILFSARREMRHDCDVALRDPADTQCRRPEKSQCAPISRATERAERFRAKRNALVSDRLV